jgi:hypothetical protein
MIPDTRGRFVGIFDRWGMQLDKRFATRRFLCRRHRQYTQKQPLRIGPPLTLCASICSFSSRSRFLLLAISSSSTIALTPSAAASSARLRLPDTSSAKRCCRSAGVSVHRFEAADFLSVVERENCRLFSFVGSSAGLWC